MSECPYFMLIIRATSNSWWKYNLRSKSYLLWTQQLSLPPIGMISPFQGEHHSQIGSENLFQPVTYDLATPMKPNHCKITCLHYWYTCYWSLVLHANNHCCKWFDCVDYINFYTILDDCAANSWISASEQISQLLIILIKSFLSSKSSMQS